MTAAYRSRARAVRAAAQARLQELRSQRTGRGGAPVRVEQGAEADPAPSPGALGAAPAPAEASLPKAPVESGGAAAAAIEVSPAALDLTREAAAAAAQNPGTAALSVSTADAADPRRGTAIPPAEPADLTDLTDLPGAGPGLIWLLRRAGVRSLGDLAALDADALRPRLGLAGQLIDLDAWIGFAAGARAGSGNGTLPEAGKGTASE